MTEVLGIVSWLLLPAIGIVVWRIPAVRALPPGGRLGVATAAGALLVALTMAALSLVGAEWSRTLIGLLLLVFIAGGCVLAFHKHASFGEQRPGVTADRIAQAGIGASVLLTLYGTATARESCGDLAFTWGPKAIRWFRAGGIDADVLRTWPQLTVDYPPLHTLLLAFSNTVASHFPWWAAVLATPLFLLVMLIAIRSFSGDDAGTLLIAATLACVFAVSAPAGCAEPTLLLFEALTIGALTFLDDPRAQTLVASLGAAGAVFTKLEGTTFTSAVVLTILIVQRNVRRAAIVAIPAAALFAAWMGFVFWNDLLYMYGGARLPIYWSALPITIKTLLKVARYNVYWLPWIIPVVLLILGNARRALIPLSICILTLGATVYFYIHYPDPVWWIESSSPRVLMTPLLALTMAAAASWREAAI